MRGWFFFATRLGQRNPSRRSSARPAAAAQSRHGRLRKAARPHLRPLRRRLRLRRRERRMLVLRGGIPSADAARGQRGGLPLPLLPARAGEGDGGGSDALSQRMIPKKPAPHLMRGGNRFPACAKPRHGPKLRTDASANEGRSERIMRHQRTVTPPRPRGGSARSARRLRRPGVAGLPDNPASRCSRRGAPAPAARRSRSPRRWSRSRGSARGWRSP